MSATCFSVAIVGAGGLGHAAALALGTSTATPDQRGLKIVIIDGDTVELSNLNRQILFTEADLGRPKSSALKERLSAWAPSELLIESHQEFVTEQNYERLFRRADFIIDATDSPATKFLINDYCVRNNKPFCYAGVTGQIGQLLYYSPGRTDQPCLRCIFGNLGDEDFRNISASCRHSGVFGFFVGHVGFLQANTVLQYLHEQTTPHTTTPQLIRINGATLETTHLSVQAAADCPLGCGTIHRAEIDLTDQDCPLTFVYTKLALEKLPIRGSLVVTFASESTAKNVEQTCSEEGHTILSSAVQKDANRWELIVQKGPMFSSHQQ